MQRRVPKSGFKNINRVEYKAVNVSVLEELAKNKNLESIGPKELVAAGFVGKRERIKILGQGSLTKALNVEAHAFSKTAEEIITKAGGGVTKIGAPKVADKAAE